MNSIDDKFYMQLALDKAWQYQCLTYPNPPVGAVVVLDGKILSIEAHKRAGSSHAEVLALLKAYETISGKVVNIDSSNALEVHNFLLNLPKNFFSKCSIYVTLEPCSHNGKTPSCAFLLKSLNLKRVIIAMKDPIVGHDGGAKILNGVDFGILEDKAQVLIEPFLIWQKRAFILFKLAQTTNGKIGGGYLSSKESLIYVHKIREVCSRLFIGGNTVRIDRPTLDCRFIGAKAPDITIYSKDKHFDKEIPLFQVDSRNIEITDNLEFLKKPSFILVEGGNGMLNALKEKIDWLLIYQTPKLSTNNLTYNTAINLEFLNYSKMGIDIQIWSRISGN